MKNDQRGFTLVESLVVLSIFILLSSVTVFSLKPQYSSMDEKAFFTQLKADLYYAQIYAISHQQEVSVSIFPNQFQYIIWVRPNEKPIIKRNYSTNLYLKEGSIPLAFKFLQDGNIDKFGSFYIQSKKKTYRMTFLIGKGRFYVTEQ
ncbi:type II secretion system GspH family protein [Neobacillus sedimentimangrovi]|uniref:Type II secretion system GspH family protein n=1 Tax=Neobacillus sedimentimangrovi TaxID=2699460 RepID=A0ABS8QG19_9BACI|nr:competence type IV pilus minor pilin ComGD [Neobacillus sedimentimangrovi]MCD4838191.1 type II secretion system GspH family protein [Neobacillus sedimentimangrovi]